MPRAQMTTTPVARFGDVEVSKYEAPTGARLLLRRLARQPAEAYLDPLELEGLTRVRYKPIPLLPSTGARAAGPDSRGSEAPVRVGDHLELLQNEFAMVGVGVARSSTEEGLLIQDMNAGQIVVLSPDELEALLLARHMDFAPLIDTSDLVSIPEPDIDEV